MNNLLEYKGYHAEIEYDTEDEIFTGSVFGIKDSLSFHGTSVNELKEMFAQSIDNYLDFCKQIGKEPDKEFKGSFNVRINPILHRDLALKAFKNKRSLNKEVEIAISIYLDEPKKTDPTIIIFNTGNKSTWDIGLTNPQSFINSHQKNDGVYSNSTLANTASIVAAIGGM